MRVQCVEKKSLRTKKYRISGAKLLAKCQESDFALLELKQAIPSTWPVYYAGWDASKSLPADNIGIGIHHPFGADKRFTVQDDSKNLTGQTNLDGIVPFKNSLADPHFLYEVNEDQNGGHFALTLDISSDLPGSSGSPFFNSSGKIIGQLHGSHVCCENDPINFPNGNNNELTRYGRLWYSWEYCGLKNLLWPNYDNDPTAPNPAYMNGVADVGSFEYLYTKYCDNTTGELELEISLPGYSSADFPITLSGDYNATVSFAEYFENGEIH